MPPNTARRILEVRDMASIYELWCHFQVVKAAEAATGGRASLNPAGREDELSVVLPFGSGVEVGDIEITYNRAFVAMPPAGFSRGGSYSVPLRPDIAVRTPAGEWHLFDAKLKRDVPAALDEISAGRDEGEDADTSLVSFRRADLHKMHAYRDALGATSVWVLYPGEDEDAAEYSPREAAGSGVPDGVGAIPLSPGMPGTRLEAVMKRILDNA